MESDKVETSGKEPITVVPKCTGDPEDCVLCDFMDNIYKGFPFEENPGCATGEASKE